MSCVLCLVSYAHAQEVELYRLAVQAPTEGNNIVTLTSVKGSSVAVVSPPVATISGSAIVGVHGLIVPLSIDPGAERWAPTGELYRIVFDLSAPAQATLKEKIGSVCRPGLDLHVAVDQEIMDHIVYLACGAFPVQITFGDRQSAEAFARKFTREPINFERSIPTPSTAAEP